MEETLGHGWAAVPSFLGWRGRCSQELALDTWEDSDCAFSPSRRKGRELWVCFLFPH